MKFTNNSFRKYKSEGVKITMLTAYDYYSALFTEKAEVDTILVGDSLGMVVMGYEDTTKVTMEDMLHHVKCVRRGAPETFVVVDMPFLSYNINIHETLKNAGRLIQEGGADAVKVEGGERSFETIKAILNLQIPVVAHLGMTPQSVNMTGGFKVQAKREEDIKQTIKDAVELDKMGVSAIVLECIPPDVAEHISSIISAPTIGIGAGKGCDGQVLVYQDLLGVTTEFKPKFVKQYANLKDDIVDSIQEYNREVKNGVFPDLEHSYKVTNFDFKKVNK